MQRNLRFSPTLGHAVVALCALWLARPSAATTLHPMDLYALSINADRILVGTVEKTESHHVSASNHYIVTDVTVRSERNVLGVPEGSTFVVRHLGGVVGEIGQRVHGEASYRVGEQVLLFAAKRQGSYYAVGMAQGNMHVYRDSAGVSRVQNQLADAELSGRTAVAPSGQTLDAVIAQVQTYLAQRQSMPERRQGRQ